MENVESFINDLQKENARLTQELEQAQKDIRDFEVLAIEWKKGHQDLKAKHHVKTTEYEQIIQELENEIEELRASIRFNSRN